MNFASILEFVTGQSEEVPQDVKGTARLSSLESLTIYKNDYFCRLQNALGEHYPMTRRILGDELFFELALDYLAKNPSANWDINEYGHLFPEFLAKSEQTLLATDFPFLPDLAKLEWENLLYFHDAEELSPVTSLPADEEEMNPLKLSCKLILFTSAFQIPRIYRAAQKEQSLLPEEWVGPSYYFLSKNNFQVHLEDLNANQYRFLKEWKNHGTFQKFIEAMEENLSDDDPMLAEIGPTIERMLRLRFCIL